MSGESSLDIVWDLQNSSHLFCKYIYNELQELSEISIYSQIAIAKTLDRNWSQVRF